MPSKSKKQQRFMGMVHAYQMGKLKNVSPSVKKAAKNIDPDDAEHFASTKHKGLPEKVKKKKKKYENQVINFSNFLNENVQDDYSPITLDLIKSNIIQCLNNLEGYEEIENNIEVNNLIDKASKDIMKSIKNSLRPDVMPDDDNYSDISNIYMDLEDKIWDEFPETIDEIDKDDNENNWVGFKGNGDID